MLRAARIAVLDTRLPSQLHGYHFWIPFRCFLDTISASRIPFLDTISLLFGYHLSFTDYHLDTIFGYHFRIPFLDTILGYHFPGFTLKRWWLSARFFYPQKFINAWVSCTKLASAHPSIAPAQNIHRTIFWIPFLDTRWYQFWISLLDTIFGYHLRITWKRRYHLSFTDYQISKFSDYHHFHFCIQNCNPEVYRFRKRVRSHRVAGSGTRLHPERSKSLETLPQDSQKS